MAEHDSTQTSTSPASTSEASTRYRRLPHVERQLARGRRFVQPLDAETPTQLSGSAPMIWDLLADHGSIDEIVAMLQQQFSDPPDVIAGGVQVALQSFLDTSLAEVAS